jgi:hypothetical protein
VALGQVSDISAIPYLDPAETADRFLSSTSFFDAGAWRTWAPVEGPGRQVVEIQAWPAESFYYGRVAEKPSDFESDFLTFLAQRVNFRGLAPYLTAIQDDVMNLSTALAKMDLIYRSGSSHDGSNRMAATEVEYILLVCRSLFDLLQELLAKLWSKVTLIDPTAKKKALKDTFSKMVLFDNKLLSPAEIAARYALPPMLADCYARHAPMFEKIRQFRDNLVHGGSRVDVIFRGDQGFLIRKRLGPFLDLQIWRDAEIEPNDLGPLKPALALIIRGTLAACEDFAVTLQRCLQFGGPTVPGMNLYVRGYYNAELLEALMDADQRLAEGRSLLTP